MKTKGEYVEGMIKGQKVIEGKFNWFLTGCNVVKWDASSQFFALTNICSYKMNNRDIELILTHSLTDKAFIGVYTLMRTILIGE